MKLGQLTGFFALVVSVYILWQIRQVVLLVFAAVVLATVLNRVVAKLQQYRVKRGIAIAITIIVLLILLFGFFAIIAPRIVQQLLQFRDVLPTTIERLRTWYEQIQALIPGRLLENIDLQPLAQQLQAGVTRLLGNFFGLVRNSLSVVVSLLLFFVVTIMLLVNPSPYRQTFVLAFPAFYRRRVDEILSECEHSLVGWIKGTLITMSIIGILSFLGLLLLRVPLPLVNAVLAGLLEFIPNVGPTLSVVPPALLALLEAPWKAVAVVVLYIAIQQVESLIILPTIMAQEVSLLPVFTILAVVVFASFFGFLGLFLAIPLLIVTQIWLKEVLVKDVLSRWQSNPKDNQQQD